MASTLAATTLAPEQRWSAPAARNAGRPDTAMTAGAPPKIAAGGRRRRTPGWIEDAGLLLLLVLALPLGMLVAGAPVALFVRLLLVIVRQG